MRAFDVNMQYGRAELLDRQYGAMLRRPPLSDLASAYHLHRALEAKGIDVTVGVVKQWMLKYRSGDAAATDPPLLLLPVVLLLKHLCYGMRSTICLLKKYVLLRIP